MKSGRKETSLDVREIIINMKKEGKTLSQISDIVKRSKSTVQSIIKRYQTSKTLDNKKRTGRPKALNPREERRILSSVRDNPKLSAPKLSKFALLNLNKDISAQCVRRLLWSKGLRARVPRKKPFISDQNRLKRVEFAKNFLEKDQSFWETVLFTDESKFNIYGCDGRSRRWRHKNQALKEKNMVPTVKHGAGSVFVWGAMSANGVGNLVFIDEKVDRFVFLELLKGNLRPSVEKLNMGNNWVFQQDNDPKHTSFLVREWLLYNVPKQLHSPPQSPDLNPIEHLWEHLERQIRYHEITNKDSLRTALEIEWNKITSDVTKNLVYSMPRRLQATLDSNGGPTKY